VNLLDNIKRVNPSLKNEEISGILYFLKNIKDLDNNKLIRLTGLPKEELRRFKLSISSLLKPMDGDKIVLSEEGIKSLSEVELFPYNWSLISYPNKDLVAKFSALREKYGLVAKREYDQWFATEESSINKYQIIVNKGCLEDKRVALLGDDDLVSTVFGLSKIDFTKTTVFDVDASLLNVIDTISKDNAFKNIETSIYDAKKELSTKYFGQYDVVVTDPPYTTSGVTLFLNRAIELLNGSDKYIFLYFGNSFKSPEKFLKIQEVLNKMGLVIEDKIDKFSRYYGAESIGSASSVYILKTTPFTHTLDIYDFSNIYTMDKVAEEKFPYVDHVVLKINKVSNSIMSSKSTLHSILNKFCMEHKLKVVDTKITDFKGGGMTLTFILSNSNLVVHTWPEHNALHIDLITCKPIFKKDTLHVTMRKLFNTNYVEMKNIE